MPVTSNLGVTGFYEVLVNNLEKLEKMKDDFLDIRNHGFLRVAVVSPRVYVADPKKNVVEHLGWVTREALRGAQLIVFPELSLSGYTCQDLFLSTALQETCLTALQALLEGTAKTNSLIVVGMPLKVGDKLFNVAVVILLGRILAVVPKTYLPDYREFRETRWFATSRHTTEKEIEVLGQRVAFGSVLIVSERYPELVMAVDICEDLWMPIPPSTFASLKGATVLVNLSSSNMTLTKDEYRKELVVSSSAKNVAVQLYVSSGFGESTTDCAWDGQGLIADRGILLAETERYQMEGSCALSDVDLTTLVADRLRMSSFRDNGEVVTGEFEKVRFGEKLGGGEKEYQELKRDYSPWPFVPQDKGQRDRRCEEVFKIQATSLSRRLLTLPEAKRRLVVGVSGGLDSTQALLVAAKTMDLLKLPRKNIVGVTMPGFGTTNRTYANAVELIKSIGATFKEIPIKDVATLLFTKVGQDSKVHDLTFENTQAWSRKYVELVVASKEGGLVLGTGDLSELWLGWCTMYGDHASHYGINSGVPKTLISHLVRWVAEVEFASEKKVREVLLDILDTPVSPELLPARSGKITQKTEEIVGPYELHDFFGYYFVRFGMKPSKIARIALAAFEGKYGIGEIKKWLRIFLTRFFANQFKRSVLPDGPKVGSVSPSPRDEWRMPSDIAVTNVWMKDWEKIPKKL